MRMAMRLLAVRRRSIEAIKRPNSVLEGRRPTDAVLDMNVPFLMCEAAPLRDRGQFMYTRYHKQQTCLHGSN